MRPFLPIRTIAVDLTPVLPGGENGGAKFFALELVRRLAARKPGTRFVLLTQAASHDELAALDRANVRRVLAVGGAASALRPRLLAAASRALSPFPDAVRRAAARTGYRLHALVKRAGPRGLLRDIEADLLFCPFTAPTFRERGIPAVCTIHDLQFRAYPQFFALEDAVLRERAFADACRHATALAADSDFSRQAALDTGDVDARRITTIALRLARDCSTRDGAAGGHGLDLEGAGYFVYPANFWKHKNHEMLLTAFAKARSSGLDGRIALVCTGAPGERMHWLAKAANRMGLGAHVHFPGYLPDAQFTELLSRARGLVFPSLYEGFGLPVLDAMASGVPVACSDTAALPEVARGSALLFDPRIPEQLARAMITLAADDAARARLIDAGRRRAAEFMDADRMAEEYWKVFEHAARS